MEGRETVCCEEESRGDRSIWTLNRYEKERKIIMTVPMPPTSEQSGLTLERSLV